jgi:hypothetical protein
MEKNMSKQPNRHTQTTKKLWSSMPDASEQGILECNDEDLLAVAGGDGNATSKGFVGGRGGIWWARDEYMAHPEKRIRYPG